MLSALLHVMDSTAVSHGRLTHFYFYTARMHKCRNLRESEGICGKIGWYVKIEANKWSALNRKLTAILV